MSKKKQAEASNIPPVPQVVTGKVALLSEDGLYTWIFLGRDGKKWKLAGGKIEDGKNPDEDVARELREEFGRDFKLGLERVSEAEKPADGKDPAKKVIGYFAVWAASNGEPPIDRKEHFGCMRIAVADIGIAGLHKVYQNIITQAGVQYQSDLQAQAANEREAAAIPAVA